VIRKSYAALRNLVTSLPNPNPDPKPNISGLVESESEKNGSDPHHWNRNRKKCVPGIVQTFKKIGGNDAKLLKKRNLYRVPLPYQPRLQMGYQPQPSKGK
jgi:hypothetical protein